jgi:hypothetical protein
MHPLVSDLSSLKDSELQTKISDLTNKYFLTSNPGVRAQMVAILEDYKSEQYRRDKVAYEKMMANRDTSLDKLIKVS